MPYLTKKKETKKVTKTNYKQQRTPILNSPEGHVS